MIMRNEYLHLFINRKRHDSSPPPPPTEQVDQGATYADPNSIKYETGPETGELYAVATKKSSSKKKKNEQNLPTYQVCVHTHAYILMNSHMYSHITRTKDPNTIKHETVGEGGDMYALPAKPKKGSKKKTAPEPPKPTEEELQQIYSLPDKSKKAQSQGRLY